MDVGPIFDLAGPWRASYPHDTAHVEGLGHGAFLFTVLHVYHEVVKLSTTSTISCMRGWYDMYVELKAQEECPNFVPSNDSTSKLPTITTPMLNCYAGLLVSMALRPSSQCHGKLKNFGVTLILLPWNIRFLSSLLDMYLPQISGIIPPYMCKSFLPVSLTLLFWMRPNKSGVEGEDMESVWTRETRMATYVYILVACLMNLPICTVQRIVDPALFLIGLTLLMFVDI